MKRVKITILMSLLWITFPSSFLLAQGSVSLVNDIQNRVDDREDLVRDIRRLQKDLDRLDEVSSKTDRLNDRADSELRKIRDQERLRNKLDRIQNRRSNQSLENDFEILRLERELDRSRQELKKAKRVANIEKELAKNNAELNKLNSVVLNEASEAMSTSNMAFQETEDSVAVYPKLDTENILKQIDDNDDLEMQVNTGLYDNPIDLGKGSKYQAYAVIDLRAEDQLEHLIKILNTGFNQEEQKYTMPLVGSERQDNNISMGTVGSQVYYGASFIVLWEEPFEYTADTIRIVLVNNLFYHAIEELSAFYPSIRFVRADEANEAL